MNCILIPKTLTCSHRGKDRVTDGRQVGGVRGRWRHLIKGVSVVDVVCAELHHHLGQKE